MVRYPKNAPASESEIGCNREFVAETHLSVANFVYPLFIHGGEEESVDIASMPGCCRLSVPSGLRKEVAAAHADGVRNVVLFPAEPDEHKTPKGEESYNPNGLVQRAIKMLKAEFADVMVYTDVALDPYSSDGPDGIVDKAKGVIVNDETVEVVQAGSQPRRRWRRRHCAQRHDGRSHWCHSPRARRRGFLPRLHSQLLRQVRVRLLRTV